MRVFYRIGMTAFYCLFLVNAQAMEFSSEEICKAAISVEMAQSVGVMKAIKSGDTPQVMYVRKIDGESFMYRCKFSGNRVVWAAYFADNQSWGRWRDDDGEFDSVLTYKIIDGGIYVHTTETDTTKVFGKGDFK